MALVIIVITLVAGLSLYDYLSSKSWQQITSAERNDLVFEDRNHAYGAYEIRKNYDRNLILVMAGVVLVIGTAFGVYKIVKNLPKPQEEEVPLDLTQFAVDAPEEEEPLEPLEPEIPPMEETIQFLPPVVTNEEVTTPPPTQQDLENTAASTTTNEGNDPFGGQAPPPPPKDPVVEKPKEPEVYTFVDEVAEFPGGAVELRKYLAEHIKYPQTAVEMGLEGKCYLTFVVSENGYISNVKVKKGVTDCKECDEEAIRVVKSMPRWKPGKLNGKEVNSVFSLPVTFKLQ